MMYKLLTYITILLVSTSLNTFAFAEHHTTAHHVTSQHNVHVHNVAELMLVIEDQTLTIQLHSPAHNLLGFEHKAYSQEDKAKVKHVQDLLNDPTRIFTITGSLCDVSSVSIDTSSVMTENSNTSNHYETAHKHSEIIAYYEYKCEQSSVISSITISLFEMFPSIETINSIYITETQQSALLLSTGKNQITLKQ